MRLPFIHCHGSGNDFPLIDARALALDGPEWATIARALADRRGPIGGDGLLLLAPGDAECAFAMTMYNPDGSEAETCLNGLRCVGRLGMTLLGLDDAVVKLKTSRALVERGPEIAPGVYTVMETAGPASLDVAAWPLHAGMAEIVDTPIPALASARRFTAVAIPNPHLIAFVERIDEAELVALGEQCEAAPAWLPNRANLSLVEQCGPAALFVRTFERGAGLTASCGSAMAAAAYAACLTGRAQWGTMLTILNQGGVVHATADDDGLVSLAGNATWTYAGSIGIDPTTGALGPLSVEARYPEEVAAWAAAVQRD